MTKKLTRIGKWCFILGLVIAAVCGFNSSPYMLPLFFLLGLVVGFLNARREESVPFLISCIVLLLIGVSGLQSLSVIGSRFARMISLAISILRNSVAFVAAVSLVVAVKQILGPLALTSKSENQPKSQ